MPGAPQTRSRVAFGVGALAVLLGALGAGELATFRASLDTTRVTTPDLTSSSGWTITALNAGSGAISGGAFTVTVPAGTTSGTGAYATRTLTFAPQFELQGCVAITADTAGEMLAGLTANWSGGSLTFYARGSGAFYLYQEGSWGFSGLTVAGSASPSTAPDGCACG